MQARSHTLLTLSSRQQRQQIIQIEKKGAERAKADYDQYAAMQVTVEREREKLREDFFSLQKQLGDTKINLRKEVEMHKMQCHNYKSQLDALRSMNGDQLGGAESNYARSSETYAVMGEIKKMSEMLQKSKVESGKLRQELQDSQSMTRQQKREIDSMTKIIEEAHAQNRALTEELQDANSKLTMEKTQRTSLQSKLEDAKNKYVSELQDLERKLRTADSEAKEASQRAKNSNNQLEAEVKREKDKFARLRQDYSTSESTINDLRRELEELKKDTTKLKHR